MLTMTIFDRRLYHLKEIHLFVLFYDLILIYNNFLFKIWLHKRDAFRWVMNFLVKYIYVSMVEVDSKMIGQGTLDFTDPESL